MALIADGKKNELAGCIPAVDCVCELQDIMKDKEFDLHISLHRLITRDTPHRDLLTESNYQ